MALLVALEGIDGSGKGTQSARLRDALAERGVAASLIGFPRYSETVFGRAIGDFLNGRFGELDAVSPYLASVLFAGDRFESRRLIDQAAADSAVVIFDRYVASNVAHQGAKLPASERRELVDWIHRVEHEVFGLPRPDLILWLDVPVATARELIARKSPRDYTDKPADLHEADGDYLTGVREVYRSLAETEPTWRTVACVDDAGALRDVESIGGEILDHVITALGSSSEGRSSR